MSDKPLLLGMNNPLSDDPHYDLYPYPEGCTGWRLWKMLPEGTSRAEYLSSFDRLNLLRSRKWNARDARRAAADVVGRLAQYELVVVLGTEVRAALGFPKSEPLAINRTRLNFLDGLRARRDSGDLDDTRRGVFVTWVAFPHPSGRNLWFNDPANYQAARDLLAGIMRKEIRP